MSAVGYAGEDAALWVCVASALAATDRRRRRLWMRIALLGPATIAVNFPLKLLVRRPRPIPPRKLRPLADTSNSPSFPSAHAVSSFAVAVAIGRVEPVSRPYVLTAAAIVALGRPYLGVHYPSDVVFGAFIGTIVGSAIPLGRVS